MRHSIALVFVAMLLSGCGLFASRSDYEEPPYDVVERLGEHLEVRRYGPRVAAEATVESYDRGTGEFTAFRALFKYITGENRGGARIDMTVPVQVAGKPETIAMTVPVETAQADGGTVRMRFFLPASYTVESAPQPVDTRVHIVRVPAQTVAVLRFTGSRADSVVTAKSRALLRELAETAWRPAATPVAYVYDHPWTLPFLRRNEVAVVVEQ